MSKDFEPTSYVDLAMQRARSISFARQDLPHLIFPASNFPIDEHLVAGVKNSLYMLVFNIERALLRKSSLTSKIADKSHAYPILLESGMMNDNAILDLALYLFRYQNLRFTGQNNNGQNNNVEPMLINKLIGRDDDEMQKCLNIMALGHSRFQSLGLGNYFELSPETLHVLTWRIVATFEIIDGKLHPDMLTATHQWLSEYDEAETISSSAAKLIYLLGKEPDFDNRPLLTYKAGYAALFIALLSKMAKINRYAVLNILTDRSPILSAILFRAIDMDRELALLNIAEIFNNRDGGGKSNNIMQIASEYEAISPQTAQKKMDDWSAMISIGEIPPAKGGSQ